MSLEQTIKDTIIAESHDLDGRLQQLVRAGLMPANTIPILRKAIGKVQGGMTLQGAERDVMATFINSMMFIVLGDDAIFNRARSGAKGYATEETEDDGWYTHSQIHGSMKSEKHPKGISAAEWKSGVRWHHAKNKRINIKEAKEKTEYDYEGDMAMGQLKSIIANSQRMHDMLSDDTNLPEWVQSKITLAEDYISTASNYMQGEMSEETITEVGPLGAIAVRGAALGGRMIASKFAKKAGASAATKAFAGDAGETIASSAATYVANKVATKFPSKKETNEEVEIEEKRGLWDNIHAKRKRIKGGSGERMRKPGSEGAPSAADLKASQTEEVQIDETSNAYRDTFGPGGTVQQKQAAKNWLTPDDTGSEAKARTPEQHKKRHAEILNVGSNKNATIAHLGKLAAHSYKVYHDIKEESEQVDEISKATAGRYINKAKDSIDMTSYRQGVKDSSAISHRQFLNGPLEKKLTKRHKGISMAVKKLTKEDIEAVKSMHESYKNTFNAALEHYNIKSPSELGEDKRKEFFNHVDQKFKKGDN